MRRLLVAFAILLASASASAYSNVSVNIGIHVPAYPTLVRIPAYPVYYAPSIRANYFFYDGLYWVFDGYDWYVSAWYNGPWQLVDRYEVPVYLLRVPVRYYRAAPVYFRSWYVDAPPRWGDHWGYTWEQRRAGWETFSLRSAPAPAPLPLYQRAYSGSRYPSLSQQVTIQTQSYRYQPRDSVARQQWQEYRSRASTVSSREARVNREQRIETRANREQRIESRANREQRIESRVNRERVARAEERAATRERPAPPAHAQAKGWPGKGHERALERERPAPPEHAQAKGWPGKGHERALERSQERVAQAQGRGRDKDEDHPGRGRGHDR